MIRTIKTQRWPHYTFYAFFALSSLIIIWYYLSNTLIHFTTPQQFPINSFERFPLTWLIFPAELFSFIFGLYFIYTLATDNSREMPKRPLRGKKDISVGILLPVYNEPKEIVERTIKACKNLRWPGKTRIYILDDSTEKGYISDMKDLAKKYRCKLIRRTDRDGYKAGNINNGIKHVAEDFFMILDADQAPEQGFLEETMDYFSEDEIAFVQTPQYFVNESTPVERTAKLGANIFFQSMCVSRSKDKAMVFCGTNAVIRKKAFMDVGGFSYYTATEDIELGIRMNDAGYHGVYVPKVLVKGYAPPDFKAYSSQQYRWSNGNLAIFRESWLKILSGNLSFKQQVHTFFAVAWWLIGIVTIIYILVPILSLALGMGTHHTWLPSALLVWLYFHVILGIGMIYVSMKSRLEGDRITLGDAFLQYSLLTNSMFIYAKAAINALFKNYTGFVRTDKKGSATKYGMIKWNLLLGTITLLAAIFALFQAARAVDLEQLRTYLPISIWLLFYAIILMSSILFVGETAKGVAVE